MIDASAPAATKGRILVVDDDRLVLATVVQGLLDAGYEVFDADNGDDALLLAREHRPQLALLDIRMAGMSGFDVAAALRDAKYGVPFMFLSAFADEATQRQVQALGAVDYLVKPLQAGQIVERVDAAFARLAGQAGAAVPAEAGTADRASTQAMAGAGAGAGAGARAELSGGAGPTTTAATIADPVPLAVGVLMHRHGLSRQAAWARLGAMAKAQGVTVGVQAERLLAAVEELARSAPPA
jgi:response regulator NasT